jgi:hypothetical protein
MIVTDGESREQLAIGNQHSALSNQQLAVVIIPLRQVMCYDFCSWRSDLMGLGPKPNGPKSTSLTSRRSSSPFKESHPYTFGVKRNPKTRELIYYVDHSTPIPPKFPVIAGDVVHDLRSALEHLAGQLVDSHDPTKLGKHTGFPIFEDAPKYKTYSPRKVQGMRPEAIKAIDTVEPYKGGKGESLWVLHELNRIDKHCLLIIAGTALRAMNFSIFLAGKIEQNFGRKSPPIPPIFGLVEDSRNTGKPVFPLETGTELLIDAPDSEVNEKMEFTLDVAFGQPEVIKGKPVVETLQSLAQFVDNVISDFEPFLL